MARAGVTITCESARRSRVNKVDINGKSLLTPCYFPAISSCATKYPCRALVKFLSGYSKPLLLSAYDLYNELGIGTPMARQFEGLSENITILDSGRFESSWFNDSEWTFDRYDEVVNLAEPDFYTSFDVFPSETSDDFVHESVRYIDK